MSDKEYTVDYLDFLCAKWQKEVYEGGYNHNDCIDLNRAFRAGYRASEDRIKELEAETQKLKERSKWEEVMNNKLVSLKDKPATKEDVGKTVYQINKHKGINTYILTEGEQKGSFKLSAIFNVKSNDCFTYWQRPVLISEQELNEVKDLLRQQCKKVCSLGKS